jgi:hypothetical protein
VAQNPGWEAIGRPVCICPQRTDRDHTISTLDHSDVTLGGGDFQRSRRRFTLPLHESEQSQGRPPAPPPMTQPSLVRCLSEIHRAAMRAEVNNQQVCCVPPHPCESRSLLTRISINFLLPFAPQYMMLQPVICFL